MKHIHTFGSFLNESKYKGNMSGDAAEYIAKELSQYVKGIISQPNDAVTYFHLTDKSDKSKVIKTLLDVYGLEAVDGGNMFSPSPTIKFDNDQLLESRITEAVEYSINDFPIGAEVTMGDEVWKVVKPGTRGEKVIMVPFNAEAKRKYISIAIEFDLNWLNANILNIKK